MHTIMVVDDDIDFLKQMNIQLEAVGYQVVPIESARAAQEALSKQRPDLVLVDLMMDEADAGFRLCYQIKQRDATIPVIIVTAVASATGIHFDAETDEEKAWIKADSLLAKPVRFEQLQREMQRLLKDEE
jgi:CheY-like chemotaxis protein